MGCVSIEFPLCKLNIGFEAEHITFCGRDTAAAAASGLCWNGRAGTAIECVLGAMADLMDRRNSLKATAMKRTGNSIDETTGAGAV